MERTITIQNLGDVSALWIEKQAKKRGVSIEVVVLELIHQGTKGSQLATYHDLDALAGTWSGAEADEFLTAVSDFERVDEKLWRAGFRR
jgi:hypothetical protein